VVCFEFLDFLSVVVSSLQGNSYELVVQVQFFSSWKIDIHEGDSSVANSKKSCSSLGHLDLSECVERFG
jgi:hypothetical protein